MSTEPGHHYHDNPDEEDLAAALQRAYMTKDPFAITIESELYNIVFTVFDDGIAQMGIVDKDWYIGRQYQEGMHEQWSFLTSEVITKIRLALERVSQHVI